MFKNNLFVKNICIIFIEVRLLRTLWCCRPSPEWCRISELPETSPEFLSTSRAPRRINSCFSPSCPSHVSTGPLPLPPQHRGWPRSRGCPSTSRPTPSKIPCPTTSHQPPTTNYCPTTLQHWLLCVPLYPQPMSIPQLPQPPIPIPLLTPTLTPNPTQASSLTFWPQRSTTTMMMNFNRTKK